ncbi:T9SS sorting signal type C domain-containing protein [Flavobacterium sp. Root420]|uniref:T9SS sorting signal type C domain-containing protein n=1 Tax=Flavobacterium sp. Root420 TaxID=1736533 RepID=UPI0006FEB8C4|nr:T9SS sorting signal type C domain-containing protein [Flavobacterium sp. Root420]KQX12982.1 hypothetical protein ASC72_19445 [Flavobacterium sp. Root420]
MDKKLLLIFFMLFCFGFSNGATITSTGTGNWTSSTSWIGGVLPTANDDVIIGTGSSITLSTNVSLKSLTINGTLFASGDPIVSTPAGNVLIVTINGLLDFNTNQSSVSFPAGTIVDINPPGKIDDTGAGCSNQVAIFIGTVKFAVCVGSGNAEYTFTQLNDLGGTLQSKPSSNAPVCEGSILNFTAAKDGADGASLNWHWSIKPPGSGSFTIYPDKQNVVSFANALPGSYEATLTYTTTYGGSVYTSSKTIFATVNIRPTAPTIAANGPTTFCSGSNVTLTSTVGSGYLWSTGATTQSIVVATTGNYSVQITNASGCQSLASAPTTVTVNAKPATPTIAANGPTTFCSGGNVTLTSTVGSGYLWSTGATTQSIVVTTSGNFSVQVTSASGCQSLVSALTAVTVNTKPATPTISANGPTTFCSGSNVTLTSTVGSGYLWSTGATTQSIVVVAAGNYSVQVTNASGCQSLASVPTTVTVRSLLATPNIVTVIQPTCVMPTGSIELGGLNAAVNGQIAQSGTFIQTYSVSNSSFTVSNLAPGTYSFTLQDGVNCSSSPTINIVISSPDINSWNGVTWSKGSAPIFSDIIEFAADYQSVGDLNGCSCKVNAGKVVTISSGHTLFVDNGVTVESVTGAKLIFENSASLIQKNNVVNTGNIIYKRASGPIRQADFVYWSTPVNPQKLVDVSPLTESDKYFRFDGTGWVITDRNTNMIVGKGYIIRGPETYSNVTRTDYTASFIGVPNNGNVTTEALDSGKYYLLGNPYPSAVDADQFILDNPILQGTLYFWTHNTPVTLGGYYRYNVDDYASYNLTGGVTTRTAALTGTAAPGNNSEVPLGKIAAGQGFFAGISLPGTITFTNAMRFGANNQFFKPAKTSKTAIVEKNRLWLNLTNTEGAFKQTLIGYIEGATNETERRYDGATFNANKYLDFYSVNNGKKLSIQGRAIPFSNIDTVPLGYKSTIAGNFTISIDKADGKLTNQAIYLEDKTTNIIHDLRTSNYTFTTTIGTFDDRFVLRYTDKTLGTVDVEDVDQMVLVSVKEKIIKVTSTKENIGKVLIFDITGKLLYEKDKVDATELEISILKSVNQVLIVRTTLENEYTNTTKVIL